MRRAFKLRGKLGGTGGLESYIPKPKWMRAATYDRKPEEIFAAEEVVYDHIEILDRKLDRLLGTLTSVPVSVVVVFDALQLGQRGFGMLAWLAPGHNHRCGGDFFAPFLGVIHRLGNAEALAGRYNCGGERGRRLHPSMMTPPLRPLACAILALVALVPMTLEA